MTYLKDTFGKDLFGQFIGFEDTVKLLQRATQQATKAAGYPPYNIKQVKDNKYVIEMAVAGFAKSDLEVTMDGNKLTIKGATKETEEESFLYQGIANRAFERTFTLDDKIEIKDAEMVNGMLKVWLQSIIKTQDAIKKIAIKSDSDE
jgi:molecular chaperone IbpA